MERLTPSQAPPYRNRLVREAAAFVLLACACGIAAQRTTPSRPPPTPAAPPPPTVPVPDVFAAIEGRAPSIAAGMRQVARRESSGEKTEIVRADRGDTCVRVAFEAAVPVIAKLVDEANTVLATTAAAALEGVLGENGPVCIRKGEALSVTVGGATTVRWVAWATP
jgi:hypothetical protein